jgi:hypothetical protein
MLETLLCYENKHALFLTKLQRTVGLLQQIVAPVQSKHELSRSSCSCYLFVRVVLNYFLAKTKHNNTTLTIELGTVH